MDDSKILALFLERSEQAIHTLAEKYGKLCLHIAGGILSSEADAEECVSDAYWKLWNTIPPEKPVSLRAYLTRVLRNICYDRCDYQNAGKRSKHLQVCMQELEECLPAAISTEQTLDAMVIRDTMNGFLRSLSKNDRYLFIRRYYCLDTCRQIGKAVGMSESAVSTRLGRLREKLKKCLEKEGILI